MANAVAVLESFWKTELGNISEVSLCVSNRIFNGVAKPGTIFPYLIYTTIPLQDDFGQARTPIQYNFLTDIQIISPLALISNIDPAVEAIFIKFGNPPSFETGGRRISIRHDRPISRLAAGAVPEEYLLYRGGTYRVWVS